MSLIYIISLLYIGVVWLSAFVTGFPIKNSFVISYTTDITRSANGKKTRSADAKGPMDAKAPADTRTSADGETLADAETSAETDGEADKEKKRLADAGRKALVDVEKKELADATKLIVINYKH